MSSNLFPQASLFIGRWQPFHAGHKMLIETVLKRGKPVVVAIRDTEISHDNPYSTAERWTMIQKALSEYYDLVKIVVIPDIDEVCYGREVGYGVRRIELDRESEAISGTKTREIIKPTKLILWLTGQSGSGKTTLANNLAPLMGAVILDGDEMRESISMGAGFAENDRHEHNIRVARLANVLARQSPVIVSVIAPFKKTRDEIDRITKPVWVYLKRDLPSTQDRPYETPDKADIIIEINEKTKSENNAKLIVERLRVLNKS